MGNRIVICHWDNGGHWNSIEISTSALNGHENHEMDIWPPVEDVTGGQNWPQGEAVYLNNCELQATETPSASPSSTGSASATPTLPDTGTGDNIVMGFAGVAMVGIGIWLKLKSMSKT